MVTDDDIGAEAGFAIGRYKAETEAIRAHAMGLIDLYIEWATPKTMEEWGKWGAEHGDTMPWEEPPIVPDDVIDEDRQDGALVVAGEGSMTVERLMSVLAKSPQDATIRLSVKMGETSFATEVATADYFRHPDYDGSNKVVIGGTQRAEDFE